MYSFDLTLSGRPVTTNVLSVSLKPASTTASLCIDEQPASTEATNLVPTHTPTAPCIRLLAKLRPLHIPPAATTMAWPPVKGDLYFLATSTTAGMRMEFGMSPVCP